MPFLGPSCFNSVEVCTHAAGMLATDRAHALARGFLPASAGWLFSRRIGGKLVVLLVSVVYCTKTFGGILPQKVSSKACTA